MTTNERQKEIWSGNNVNNLFRKSNIPKINDNIINLVRKLTGSPKERAESLHTLSVQRETIPDLAKYLWYSSCTISTLLGEIISIYPYLATNNLGSSISNRVCNVLALFQCVAGHDETRIPFINANIPIYLFPFLHHMNTSKEAEYFKLTSLGIIGSLVKSDQPEIIDYLLNADFVPLCLRILKFSQEISRTVAAFIIQKIICDDGGRKYICSAKDRLETLLKVLNKVIIDISKDPSPRLAKHLIASYQKLLETNECKSLIHSMITIDLLQLQLSPACDESFKLFVNELKQYGK